MNYNTYYYYKGVMNMKFRSDYLDYACDGMLGHKNWAYENTLISLEELKKKSSKLDNIKD